MCSHMYKMDSSALSRIPLLQVVLRNPHFAGFISEDKQIVEGPEAPEVLTADNTYRAAEYDAADPGSEHVMVAGSMQYLWRDILKFKRHIQIGPYDYEVVPCVTRGDAINHRGRRPCGPGAGSHPRVRTPLLRYPPP